MGSIKTEMASDAMKTDDLMFLFMLAVVLVPLALCGALLLWFMVILRQTRDAAQQQVKLLEAIVRGRRQERE